jgi:hypothetical protein
VILDANGSMLTPGLIGYAWSQVPVHLRRGAYLLISRRQWDALRKTSHPTAGLFGDGFGLPIQDNVHVQDDAVFIYGGEDKLDQLVMIKNIAVPPKEPEVNG